MHRRLLLGSLITSACLATASPARAATNNLWIAWDSNTTACKAQVEAFYDCVLNSSNFNALALKYPNGESLAVAGTAVLNANCAANDFNCVVNNAGFAIKKYDVVMHYYGTTWVGGTNGTATVNGVLINTAYVQAGTNCNGQTCTGAHEAFEAATNGISADCCNGQVGSASCPLCDGTCGKFTGNNGNPPWGCYDLVCPSGTYKMELLSDWPTVYNASGCTMVTVGGCNGKTQINQPCANDGECCSGLICRNWDYDGKPPYVTNCCKAVGADCAANTECCGGSNCGGGKCGCVPDGQWCINADECCAGDVCDLNQHKCVTAPPPDAGAGAGGAAASGAGAGGSGGIGGGGGSSNGGGTKAGCGCAVTGAAGGDGMAALWGAVIAAALARRRRR